MPPRYALGHQICLPLGDEALYGDQVVAKQCYLVTVNTKVAIEEVQLMEEEVREVLEDVGLRPKS